MRSDRVHKEEADADHFVRYPSILSEEEYAELQARPRFKKWGTVCPTCQDTGTYRWNKKTHECKVDFDNKCMQWKLWRMYELSNIPDRYQRLNWNDIGNSQNAAKKMVDVYISTLSEAVKRGYGLYIFSEGMGVGKTFSATHILKEAAKLDTTKVVHRGYFVSFSDLLDSYNDEWMQQKMLQTNILVVDDVTAPSTEGQIELFGRTLEKILRYRSSNDLPTVVTSNLTWETFAKVYPRCHSVLSDSVDLIELEDAFDYRVQTGVGRAANASHDREVPPIT